MGIVYKLTSKAQVTVPKDVRAALGIGPGDGICYERDAQGRVILAKGGAPAGETIEQRKARIRAALEAVRGKYPNPDGMTTDEYMRWLRGDWVP